MTAVDVSFRCGRPPGEAELRALQAAREVYGMRRIRFEPRDSIVSVEYDASRLNEATVESLLRQAGLDLQGRIAQG
ncbi:MAG TPA: hypothetical protein VLT85_12170 [Terriglobales bacterium]|nr:hypothetical protein [Terriglobales bacterium]